MKIKFIANIKGIYLGYSFDQSTVITIGREIGNTIAPINVDGFSRHHARIFFKDGGWYIEDLGSTNGTYRNHVKIEGPTKIEKGDSLRCGLMELASFAFPADEEEPAAAPASAPAAAPAPAPAPAPAAPISPISPVKPASPISPIKPAAPVIPAKPVAPAAPVAELEPVADLEPVAELEPVEAAKPAAPAAGAGVIRRPTIPGLKPGLKLPTKPGALGPGLKLPPKPGLKPGLKLPPKP